MWTHFFLTVKGMGQMMAEKSRSSEARSAKHTNYQYRSSGIERLMGELTRVVELRLTREEELFSTFSTTISVEELTVILAGVGDGRDESDWVCI